MKKTSLRNEIWTVLKKWGPLLLVGGALVVAACSASVSEEDNGTDRGGTNGSPKGSGGTNGPSGGTTSTGGSASGGTDSGGSSSGGASSSSGGASSSGGSASGGSTIVGATENNLLVAFIGDQGATANSDAVLTLIKNEGAAAVVHNGDFDYDSKPADWESRINGILGEDFPYFATIGNHDALAWSTPNGYGKRIADRIARVSEMKCTGTAGIQSDCSFRGLHLIQSCVGTSEYVLASCGKDSTTQVEFIADSLKNSDAIWNVCSWHKNQTDMQLGSKGNEVGWKAYQACQAAGAIISTGHEHSYGRTYELTNLGDAASAHGKTGNVDSISLSAGHTFVFVSGLAGVGVRDFDTSLHSDDTWWASQYTSDRWMKSGTLQAGTGTYGVLFIKFHIDGDPKKATAYFKDVSGRIVDSFTIVAP